MLDLHTIKSARGAIKKRKRVGRGNASGHGTYSTRGLKGQKSRSGVGGLKRLGMRSILLNIPKMKGFKSKKAKSQVVNLEDLNKQFKDGDKITPATLLKRGLIKEIALPVKILGKGKLELKNLHFEKVKISESAKEQIKVNIKN
jgi:large subunit ribosomal protein L15